MDYRRFYKVLFEPLDRILGPVNAETIVSLIGFDTGGPLNFCTIGADVGPVITYVSCELAVRAEQRPASFGRYELLASCDDERWVRSVLTGLGHMSCEVQLDHGHTVDLGGHVDEGAALQGVVLEKLYATRVDGVSYGIIRAIGVTRSELNYALEHGVPSLVRVLEEHGVHPTTLIGRASVV